MEPPKNVASKSPLFGAVGLGVACPIVFEAPNMMDVANVLKYFKYC